MPADALFDPIFGSDATTDATSPEAWLAALLDFERELALAQADLGLLSPAEAQGVVAATSQPHVTPAQLGSAAQASGNPVVPLVAELSSAGAPVHRGATSQDAMDTAAMLVALRAGRAILADLGAAAVACASLTRRHRATLMTGRTLLQPALPITFGLKAGGWLVALTEAGDGLGRVLSERLAVQLGGAAGTLAAFGDRGLALSARLAERLGLAAPLVPWHTDRSRLVDLAHALVRVAAACAKVALDVVLLAQAEVAEVRESGGPAHGGSSTMPQKANPVGSVTVLAAARRAQGAASVLESSSVQDHERAATGGWHAEWQALNDCLRATGGCAAGVRRLLDGLQVDVERMAANLARTHGTIVAERVALDLARDLGRAQAIAVVGRATRKALEDEQPLRRALGADPDVAALRSPDELDALCDPAGYLGMTDQLVERALALHEASRPQGGTA